VLGHQNPTTLLAQDASALLEIRRKYGAFQLEQIPKESLMQKIQTHYRRLLIII
jgi:hypothetical protein